MAISSRIQQNLMNRSLEAMVRNPAKYEQALKAMLARTPQKQKGFFETLFKSLFIDTLAKFGKWQAVQEFSQRWFGADTRLQNPTDAIGSNYGVQPTYGTGGAYGSGPVYTSGSAYGVGGSYQSSVGGAYGANNTAYAGLARAADSAGAEANRLLDKARRGEKLSESEMAVLQDAQQRKAMMWQMLSQLMQMEHDTKKNFVQNLRA